jgi:hypothetical protein
VAPLDQRLSRDAAYVSSSSGHQYLHRCHCVPPPTTPSSILPFCSPHFR